MPLFYISKLKIISFSTPLTDFFLSLFNEVHAESMRATLDLGSCYEPEVIFQLLLL